MLIATRLPREDGPERLAGLERELGLPVYLLTPELRTRFALERVPAVVTAEGERLVVREEPPA